MLGMQRVSESTGLASSWAKQRAFGVSTCGRARGRDGCSQDAAQTTAKRAIVDVTECYPSVAPFAPPLMVAPPVLISRPVEVDAVLCSRGTSGGPEGGLTEQTECPGQQYDHGLAVVLVVVYPSSHSPCPSLVCRCRVCDVLMPPTQRRCRSLSLCIDGHLVTYM